MNKLKVVEKRRSVREYKSKTLSTHDRNYINEIINTKPELAKDAHLELKFIEDGDMVFNHLEGHAGYYGKMIKSPHYVAILSDSSDKCYKIAGYVGEWFILKTTMEDIGSCWIEVIDSEKVNEVLGFETEKVVVALIALGYAKTEMRLSHIYTTTRRGSLSTLTDLGYPDINPSFSKEPVSNRKSITDFVYLNEWGNIPELEELELRGLNEAFFYMRLAPSYTNRQPWYFIVSGNEILLTIENDGEIGKIIQCVEAGIAMFYFEVAMHDAGMPGKWMIENYENGVKIPEAYKLVGKYHY